MVEEHPMPNDYRFQNLTGNRYGNLEVIAFGGRSASGGRMWYCRCICGIVKKFHAGDLKSSRIACRIGGCPEVREAEVYSSIKVSATGCLEWTGRKDDDGYGYTSVSGKQYRMHRFMYEKHIGIVPDGLYVLHRCDNPPCCNPAHLFLGTAATNAADCVAKGRNVRGVRVGISKMNDDKVRAMRIKRFQGSTLKELAEEFGIDITSACDIVNGKTWKHV